jgi:hypothetical protein
MVRQFSALGIGTASALVVPFGCGVDKDPLPPLSSGAPHPIFPEPSDASSESSSAPDAGGGTSNVCQCAVGIFAGGDAHCASCVKAVSAHGQACEGVRIACSTDPDCEKVISCLGRCVKDGGEVTSCIDGCLLPLDKDSAHEKYAALLSCACPLCAACATPSPIPCGEGAGGADAGGADDADAAGADDADAAGADDADAGG